MREQENVRKGGEETFVRDEGTFARGDGPSGPPYS